MRPRPRMRTSSPIIIFFRGENVCESGSNSCGKWGSIKTGTAEPTRLLMTLTAAAATTTTTTTTVTDLAAMINSYHDDRCSYHDCQRRKTMRMKSLNTNVNSRCIVTSQNGKQPHTLGWELQTPQAPCHVKSQNGKPPRTLGRELQHRKLPQSRLTYIS